MANVLITGCSTGIGLATAQHLAKNGHKVFATMRNPASSGLKKFALEERLDITVYRLDVNAEASIQETLSAIYSSGSTVDVLINNAGIEKLKPVEEEEMDDFKNIMETNYLGTVRCTKAVVPEMRKRKSGLIINVSSLLGEIYTNFHSAYCASKAAVEAFSECLAQELYPHKIRVCVLQPGIMETPILDKRNPVNNSTEYPHIFRYRSLLDAGRDRKIPPMEAAKVILEIIESEVPSFRYPAGPDAKPFLDWRKSMNDEEWVSSVGIDEETWLTGMQQMGLEVNGHYKRYKSSAQVAAREK